MKLSEAIRLGAMMKPQAFGDYFRGGIRKRWQRILNFLGLYSAQESSCAWGAALEGGFGYLDSEDDVVYPDEYNWLSESIIRCPACHIGQSTFYLIVHLNDDHRWTRERIADWVESIENAQQSESRALQCAGKG